MPSRDWDKLQDSKTCSRCHKEQPISEFEKHKTGKDGRRNQCKSCVRQRVRDYKLKHPKVYAEMKRRWRQKNLSHLNAYSKAYAAKVRQEKLSARPAPRPCPKGHNEPQFWMKGAWHCRSCIRLEANKRERLRERKISALKRAKNLETEFGSKFASTYLDLVSKHPNKSTNMRLVEVIRTMLPSAYQRLRTENIERIYQMNRLLNLPIWNIGWTCQRCSIYSADFRFFDIDHVTPVHKKGHGRRDNLQVLCPNCHRRKTICDLYGSALDPDFLSVSDYRTTSTQHRSNPVLNQESIPRPGITPGCLPSSHGIDTTPRPLSPGDTSNSPVDQCPAVNTKT